MGEADKKAIVELRNLCSKCADNNRCKNYCRNSLELLEKHNFFTPLPNPKEKPQNGLYMEGTNRLKPIHNSA